MQGDYRIYPLGDQAITIEFGDAIDETINRHCHNIAALLLNARIPGTRDVIPAYASVSLTYDALAASRELHTHSPQAAITDLVASVIGNYSWAALPTARTVEVPACFDPALAPDLAEACDRLGLSSAQLVQTFISRAYRVYMIGFLPGFAYMGRLDDSIALGRKEKPHFSIPPGSIGIAGHQTGIYPLESPGGWNIIGRTPIQLFTPGADNPCFFRNGDEVRFFQISLSEFHQQNQQL